MTSKADTMTSKADRFLELHHSSQPLLMPNAWDTGSTRILASLGFQALATTSSGYAATLGRLDYSVTREEALGHARTIVNATDLPVSGDLENGFGDEPDDVVQTVRGAIDAGLAGCSVEDFTGDPDDPIYDFERATARVAAAADAAHQGGPHLVLTARAENYLHGRRDLDDTIARLRAYEQAGADVLYAPGVTGADEIKRLVGSVGRPVNVLARAGVPPVEELTGLGVARVSVGGAFAFAALGTLVDAAVELRDHGTYGYTERVAVGLRRAREAFENRT